MKTNEWHHINYPQDIKALGVDSLKNVAKAIRNLIIETVATKEGHLGASLGVVELTIALHYVFDTPKDILVWDVGHQAYGHKILTGRKDFFYTNRQLGGLSGFPKRSESEYDAFGTGHSSTAISAVLGMAMASHIKGAYEKQHIAVVGDASIASGMAFEGMNHAGVTEANMLIILNDNAIGIDPSVGALKNYLTSVKKGTTKQENIFEALNFNYEGPVDGHNIEDLIAVLKKLKRIKGPKFLHVITTKGKGLKQAEENQVVYHAPGKFDSQTGKLALKNKKLEPPKYQDVFGISLVELAKKNANIIGITPAMPTGSSLKFMMDIFPKRAFDVGIAEQHAVTLAAGLATQGMVVFCNIYSTFLQRGYDQIIHDVALQKLPVIFCIDRAGLVGEDGPTHHGVFDLAYLNCIPNLYIMAPRNEIELRNIMYTAQLGLEAPIAIRYPRGKGITINWQQPFQKLILGKGEILKEGTKTVVLSIGNTAHMVTQVLKELKNPDTIGHIDIRFLKPLDTKLLHWACSTYKHIVTIEDGCLIGGLGSSISQFIHLEKYQVRLNSFGIPDTFIEHGSVFEQQQIAKIDAVSFKNFLKSKA